MCCQLFQLEEAIKSQKQVLSNLESDLQRELNPNQTGHANEAGLVQQQQHQQPVMPDQQPQMHNETPETVELRNEVNYSREQTRLQCKQLHDLDMRMKQNEQSLMAKEQQLQQLLEELYIQEIYADNALETAITGAPAAPPTNTTNFNMSTFKMSNSSPNSSIGQLMLNKAEEQQQQLPNDTVDSFENDAQEKMVELIINERNSFNNSSIDFIQQKRLACLQKQQDTFLVEEHHKRHIRMFGDTDDLLNANMGEPKHNNNNNNNPAKPCGLNPQHKSLSFGNLTNQSNPNQQSKPKPTNLNHSLSMKPSYQQAELIAEIHNHTMSASIKNLKLNNGLNPNVVANGSTSSNGSGGDHSGGDNDSGISSMSSETAATMGSNPSGLTSTSSFHQQYHKPIIMNQYTHNPKHMMPINGQMFSQPYMTQMSHQYQTNQFHQQHRAPYHQAHHTSSSTNVGNTKSVLETLV